MRNVMIGMVLAAALAGPARAAEPSLAGNWTVDLTAKAGDTPYTKPMTLVLAADGSVTGSFYESTIEGGRWKTSRSRTCVSFRTSDGKGPYHTAACLEGERVIGQTWAEHRNFV